MGVITVFRKGVLNLPKAFREIWKCLSEDKNKIRTEL